MNTKVTVISIALCLMGMAAWAAEGSGDPIKAPRPKVGIVLGGGGAKGAAHIGVLKYIEEMGIPIDYVAGTSMGSIIGGLYSMGYSPDELATLIAGMNWSEYVGNSLDRSAMSPEVRKRNSSLALIIPFSMDMFKKSDSKNVASYLPSAYVNNTALINLFNSLCVGYQEETDFNDLPIPFACVATDIATGNEVIIRHGSVPTAMRASMAIPGVFAPVLMDHKVLVDGGLVNNFPADVIKSMGADIIIGVEVSDKVDSELDGVPSLPQVLSYLIANSIGPKRGTNKELCTLYLDPDITGYGTMSFSPDAIDSLVNRGYQRAKQSHEQLSRIKEYVEKNEKHPVGKTLHAPKAKNLKDAPVFVSNITMNHSGNVPGDWLAKKGGLKVGNYISAEDIDHAVDSYRGTGAFDDITYNIYETDMKLPDGTDTYRLVLNFTPALPHVVGIGTHYDTEEGAAMLIHLGLNEKRLSGFKFRMTGRLSYNPRFNATATYAWIPVANLNIAYDYRNQQFQMMVKELDAYTNMHYEQHRFSAYASQFQMRHISSQLGFSYDITNFYQTDSIIKGNRLYGPFLQIRYDNLDDSYFARRGVDAEFKAQLHFDQAKPGTLIHAYSLSCEGYFTPWNGRVTIIPQLYGRFVFGAANYANLWNAIGGDIPARHFDQQMPFIGVNHLNETCGMSSILRCDVRYNFYGKHYITALGNVLLGMDSSNLNTGNLFKETYVGVGLRYAYNSPLGPIALTAQWSNYINQFSMFFSIGYNF